jgi:uncharacterized protein YbjT (DUF2867 family)
MRLRPTMVLDAAAAAMTGPAGTSLFQVQGPVPLEGDGYLSAAGLTALVAERTGRDIVIHSVSWATR